MRRINKVSLSIALLVILGLFAFLLMKINTTQAVLFVIGVGLGLVLLHAAFGFAGAWREFIRNRRSLGVRAHILLLMLSSILFFPLVGKFFPQIVVHGAVAQFGLSVFFGAFLFGIGMQLGGGCGSGTLYTVGQGQVDMLVTLLFFIVGATLGSAHLDWWMALPNAGNLSVITLYGWPVALTAQLLVLVVLYIIVVRMDRARNSRSIKPVFVAPRGKPGLVRGPWPLWGGVLGLSVLGLATLLIAGYPWSITFAFGLWGTKFWQAMGGDITGWAYWNNPVAAQALNQSVLFDKTSIMDFGIILGAVLAAALAGKFAPEDRYKMKRIVSAVLGGLLLGYGARLAFGCNIGAMLGGIASGSLHGWLWLVSAFAGGVFGVYVRIWMGLDRPMGRRRTVGEWGD